MIIGNETREIKARIISVEWNEIASSGNVGIQYYYESVVVEGEQSVTTIVPVHGFSYAISTSPITSAKTNTLLTDAVNANPLP